MEPRTENKKSSLENTVLIMWAQICGIFALIVHKMTYKKTRPRYSVPISGV
jgi:hypothetical protein